MNLKTLAQNILNSKQDIIISTHIVPDGDALGSEVALAIGLKKLRRNVCIINQDQTPLPFNFLNEHFAIETIVNKKIEKPAIFLLVDVNNVEKTGTDIAYAISANSENEIYFIDHHEPAMQIQHARYFIDENVSSTGEIIYRLLIEELKIELDLPIAEAVYTAIISDTRSFRYSRTTAYSHYIAAKLIEKGVSPEEIQLKVFGSNTMQQMQMLGHMLCNSQTACSNKVAYAIITKDIMDRFNVAASDTKGFINHLLTVRGIEIAIMFREEKPHNFKVSIRSKGKYPIADVAKGFGGGGHKFAATFVHKGHIDSLIPKVISDIDEMMRK